MSVLAVGVSAARLGLCAASGPSQVRAGREAAGEGNFGCFKLLGPELAVLEEQLSSFFLSITEQNIKLMLHEALSFVDCCLVGLFGFFLFLMYF